MVTNESLVRASLASGITLALLVGIASAAMAQDVTVRARPVPTIATENVYFGDLNLASRHGVKTLKTRVGGAVGRVCEPDNETFSYIDCRGSAWDGARPQIALAVKRAQQLAANGRTNIAPVAIVIASGQ